MSPNDGICKYIYIYIYIYIYTYIYIYIYSQACDLQVAFGGGFPLLTFMELHVIMGAILN